MKNIIRSLPGKIALFFLCILLLAVSVVAALTTYIMAEHDFYRYNREQLVEAIQYDLLYTERFDILSMISDGVFSQAEQITYDPARTNLRFLITGPTGNRLASNVENPPVPTDPVWRYQFPYSMNSPYYEAEAGICLYAYLEEGLPVQDKYALATTGVDAAYRLRYWLLPIAICALGLSLLCYICLLCVSARKPRSEHLYPGPGHRVPFDLLLAAVGCLGMGALILHDRWYDGGLLFTLSVLLTLVAAVAVFIGLSMSTAARIKTRTLVKNTVVYRIWTRLIKLCKLTSRFLNGAWTHLRTLLHSLPMIWRTVALAAVLITGDFLLYCLTYEQEGLTFPLWVLRTAVLLSVALYGALFMRKLQAGGRALAEGDLSHRVDTSLMFLDFKEHGENLNRISQGMALAVEQRLQSERMKTELITNVSHDIKTPLTSIINYAGLIAEVPCEQPAHGEYAQVLLRKSEHLKRLLDDLVEISRATTGNLEVALSACDAGVLLTQTAGEFQQRCENAGLTLVMSQPEEPVHILADSRRIYRIFENLMGNVCKYSLTGSRVFLTLRQEEQEAVIVLRNTSNTVLNISAQELMERFVRGDSARSTEGNGLGLSIAQSLTQLQGGSMEVTIDGDIFRVTLRFPLA